MDDLDTLEAIVICPIHLDYLEDPRLLPCGHAYCKKCLDGYINAAGLPNDISTCKQFRCPNCNSLTSVKATEGAAGLPIAFYHNSILDFVMKAKSQRKVEDVSVETLKLPVDNNADKMKRKSSIQMTSEALKSIVRGISINKEDEENQKRKHPIGTVDVVPTAPPFEPPPCTRSISDEPHTATPFKDCKKSANMSRNKSLDCNSNKKFENYEFYRDITYVEERMKSGASYLGLNNLQGMCILPKTHTKIVDMQILPINNLGDAMRFTIAADGRSDNICLYSRTVTLTARRQTKKVDYRASRNDDESRLTSKIRLDKDITIRVRYVRYYKMRIYMTALAERKNGTDSPSRGVSYPDGVVICCASPDPKVYNQMGDKEDFDLFPIQSVSDFIKPDLNYAANHDVICGLDIDRRTNYVYVASPSNFSIYKMNPDNLQVIENIWCLNSPRCHPEYLCFVSNQDEIWATCIEQDMLVVLDTKDYTYCHVKPSEILLERPTHIIYTSDGRVILLDSLSSLLYWVTRERGQMCACKLNQGLSRDKELRLTAIQPVEDANAVESTAEGNMRVLRGGIMCANEICAYMIYPKLNLARNAPLLQVMCCAASKLNFLQG